ncbi:hypothetical protein ABTY59_28840 [Streptomyces sp. NPDC096079]|uniref:hypothetical protein n=1 Tax=unclassified Streptomyces TaxID=2593676 RepID=UPI003328A212
MTDHSEALFDAGPIGRVLDLAIRAQAPDGPRLEDQLDRFCRVVRDSSVASWVMPLAAVSALLDQLADLVAERGTASLPAFARERLTRAAGDDWPVVDLLRFLADYTRDEDAEPSPDPSRLPESSWEIWVRYATINMFSSRFMSGEHTVAEAARISVAGRHPDECHTLTAALAGEIQRALLAYRTPAELDANLGFSIPWATHDTLTVLLRAVLDHFAEAHGDGTEATTW